MDKNAIKKYAVWARRELIERVSQRAMIYGITAKDAGDPNAESVNGHLLSQAEKRQRQALIRNIKTKGYEQVMEEVAYTWFNRFAALRFMEVNGYLPSHIRVFTNDAGEFKPQILAEAIHLELDGLDMNKVYELESANKSEDLFKYLLIVQCNALNSILPGMFQRIEDYTELLLPDYLLREGSVIEQMVTTIPEEDWTDQVQIIGWLYQFYNIELKDKVFANLKKKIKITKETLPAATQLFTPDWIVRYMVENSLGRLWLEGHPNDTLKSEWNYYLDEAVQEPEVQAKLTEIRKEYATLKPEEIRVIDPCMGSGHILCVLFDVLVRIYEDYGYTAREAAVKIVENNLWGLDIDERAAQLSYFAVMMKARQYDRRFFTKKVQPHVYCIEESNGISLDAIIHFGDALSEEEKIEARKGLSVLLSEMHDAKERGSLIQTSKLNWDQLRRYFAPVEGAQLHLDLFGSIDSEERLLNIINVAEALSQTYDVTITNPPYMVLSNAEESLVSFVKDKYDEGKADLFAAFIVRCKKFARKNRFQAMITQHSWMYLSSFEKIRRSLINLQLDSLLHLGAHAFEEIGGEVVQTAAFVLRCTPNNRFTSQVIRLVEQGSEKEKQESYLHNRNINTIKAERFLAIEGAPIAYRATDAILSVFNRAKKLSDIANPRQGLISGDVNRFVRKWFECDCTKTSFTNDRSKKWFPYNNGGECRRWFGNNDDVVNWENDGFEIQNFRDEKGKQRSRPQNQQYYFQEGGTWTAISSGMFSVRFFPQGFLFSNAGMGIYAGHNTLLYLIGFLNSKLSQLYLHLFNEGLNYNQGDIAKLPIIYEKARADRIVEIVLKCVDVEKAEWDSFETSWGFKVNPLVSAAMAIRRSNNSVTVGKAFLQWQELAEKRFEDLKTLEEELNTIFIEIYGLSRDVTPEVKEQDITIRRASLERDIKCLISYAVGCMFGRYSLDNAGLVYAGGVWDTSKYTSYPADKDAIIPICDDEYFEDDIVGRFVKFIEVVFGKETVEENLRFIADVIGGKGSSREVIRSYFINDFFADHVRMYQKRPIYWLFDSGKKNGFKCLIYIHRYQPDTIARIRTDYVHEQQSRYRTAIADIEQRMVGAPSSERIKLSKAMSNLQAQSEEVQGFEEKIHHLADQMIRLDLDDGVRANYSILKDVLQRI
ncbi:MAG: BREX-1 system adenine-specific DNA-methyltransferase PglX [Lachnospiraceae bacterium]|nr:BREX-1 system adenine-specific DNA-methyltransferase PglX [Lachnospiraceae bacterium]